MPLCSLRFAHHCRHSSGFTAVPTEAQQFDRAGRDEPEVVVAAGGRVGTCDVIRFTPAATSSSRPATTRSSASGRTPRTDSIPIRGTPALSTGDRGAISSAASRRMAVSPDGKRVAVGGYGLRISSVAISTATTEETLAITWPESREGGANFDAVKAGGVRPERQARRLRHRRRQPVAVGTEEARTPRGRADLECPGPRRDNSRSRGARTEKGEAGFQLPALDPLPGQNTLVGVSRMRPGARMRPRREDDRRPERRAAGRQDAIQCRTRAWKQRSITSSASSGPRMASGSRSRRPATSRCCARPTAKRIVPVRLAEDEFIRSIAIDATGKRLAMGSAAHCTGGNPRFFMEDNDRDPALRELDRRDAAEAEGDHAHRARRGAGVSSRSSIASRSRAATRTK